MCIIHTLHVYTKQTGFFFTMIMEIPPFPLTSRVDDILLNESVCDRSGANNCALLSFEFCV